jgi:hypothetical protein
MTGSMYTTNHLFEDAAFISVNGWNRNLNIELGPNEVKILANGSNSSGTKIMSVVSRLKRFGDWSDIDTE